MNMKRGGAKRKDRDPLEKRDATATTTTVVSFTYTNNTYRTWRRETGND